MEAARPRNSRTLGRPVVDQKVRMAVGVDVVQSNGGDREVGKPVLF